MPVSRKEKAIKQKHPSSYESIKEDIASLEEGAIAQKRGTISEVGRKAIDDVLDYIRTLEGELKGRHCCKDYLPIQDKVLNDRLTLVRQLITAIQQSKESKSDAPIVLCYHLMITKKIKYGRIKYSNLKDLLENTFRQMQEGTLAPTVPPTEVGGISLCELADPVMVPTGQVCDLSNITKWLNEHNFKCPYTRETLHPEDLIPVSIANDSLANSSSQYFNRRGTDDSDTELKQDSEVSVEFQTR